MEGTSQLITNAQKLWRFENFVELVHLSQQLQNKQMDNDDEEFLYGDDDDEPTKSNYSVPVTNGMSRFYYRIVF